MASASFRVSNTVGLAIRKGITDKEFQGSRNHKTVIGPPAGFEHSIATIPIAGQSFGTIMGLFQKCIGVQWEGPSFVYTAASYIGPKDVGIVAVSKNGKDFTLSQLDGFGSAGCGLIAGIRGGGAIVAVGYSVQTFTVFPQGFETHIDVPTPLVIFSIDRGQSWSEVGIGARAPSVSLGFNDAIEIINGGQAMAVAYDPTAKQFWVTTVYFTGQLSGAGTVDLEFLTGNPRGSFGGGAGASADSSQTSPLPLPDWPPGTLVNDANIISSGSGLVCDTSPNVKYVASNVAGQVVRVKSGETIAGSGVSATIGTVGKDDITAVVNMDGSLTMTGGNSESQNPLAGTAENGWGPQYMLNGGTTVLNTLFATVSFS